MTQNYNEDIAIHTVKLTPFQRLYNALWRWQYSTRMSITRPLRLALLRRKMNRRKGGLRMLNRTDA